MSAKPCSSCGRPIVFGKDRDNDKWIALDNTVPIYKIVKGAEVERTTSERILIAHAFVCPAVKKVVDLYTHEPPKDFSEPKEPEL